MGHNSKINLDKENQKTNIWQSGKNYESEKAANSIVKMVQMKSFGEEIRIQGANSDRIEDSKSIKLYKSDPFLDSDGL